MGQPTMQQVAERAGVSTALVSLVMRNAPNVSEHRRQRVLEAADELGYRPNVLARNLASRRTNTIGLVLNDLHNVFFAEVTDGVEHAAEQAGQRILIGNGRHSAEGESDAVETFLQFRVDGIIVAGSLGLDTVRKAATTTPMVVVGRTDELDEADTVNVDDAVGAKLAVDHLVSLGHERIALIDGGSSAGAPERAQGYADAMRSHGLEAHIRVARGDFTEAGGAAAAHELLDGGERPTAIFAGNDLSAVGAFDVLMDRGLAIPDDMSLVGFDNTALAAMAHLALTTVDQPTFDLGAAALDLLLERINDNRTESKRVIRQPDLVVRDSTAPRRP